MKRLLLGSLLSCMVVGQVFANKEDKAENYGKKALFGAGLFAAGKGLSFWSKRTRPIYENWYKSQADNLLEKYQPYKIDSQYNFPSRSVEQNFVADFFKFGRGAIGRFVGLPIVGRLAVFSGLCLGSYNAYKGARAYYNEQRVEEQRLQEA